MYYLGIKCNGDHYDLDYLDFYFEDYDELCEFAKTIMKYSDYGMIISKCGEEDE